MSGTHADGIQLLQATRDARATAASKGPRNALSWPAIRGLAVAAFGGLCFAFFSPLFNLAVNDEFGWAECPPLTVWSANFYFCLSFGVSAWLSQLALMRWPARLTSRHGGPSSLSQYLAEGWRNRRLACATGALCALGNTLQFGGGAMVSFAAADLVQAFPLVGTLWGILLFGEFRGASHLVRALLGGMYVAYIAAVALLIASVRDPLPHEHGNATSRMTC